mgnify:CR=1 FL=1
MTLIYLSLSWVVGIYLGSRVALPAGATLIGLLPLLTIAILYRHKKAVLLAGLCLIALLGGALRFQWSVPAVDENYLQFYNDSGTVEITGMVNIDPEPRDAAVQLNLSAREIKVDEERREISGTALIRVDRFPSYHYGDLLQVTGNLETPPQLDDFDYKDYLAHQGIHSTMLYPKVEVIEQGKGLRPLEWLYSARNRLSQSLAAALPEPHGSLAQGMLLGMRGNIPTSLKGDFSHSGTAHLLAISGLHLSIIIGILLSIGIWLSGTKRSIYIWLAIIAVWIYVLLAGMRPPLIRAAIMGSLFLFAEHLGRQRNAATALAFAAAVMVGIHPQILWQAGFQLSFLAMAGLTFISPPLQTWGRGAIANRLGKEGAAVTAANFISDDLMVTSSAIIATWPVIAYNFDILSLVALPATFFALLALPGIIVTAALVGVLGLFAPPLAQVVGWLAWLFLSYLIIVVQGFAALPLSSIEVGQLSSTPVWCYYLVLAGVIWAGSNKERRNGILTRVTQWARLMARGISEIAFKLSRPKKWVAFPLILVATLVWIAAITMPDDHLHVSFLDVGDGDAILIQRGSQQVLIDGGPSPQAIGLELGKKMPFWDRTIELLVLTHPQDDHIAGLVEVLGRYKVEQVLGPGFEYDTAAYEEWLSLIEEKNIKRTIARAGYQIELGDGIKAEVLHPQEEFLEGTDSDANNNSIVLRLNWGEVSFLLTADIEEEAEWELMTRRANLSSTVLKVGHHGSDSSTTPEFLAVANPHLAVISVGEDNRFGHPSEDVIDRLEEKLDSENIYRTDEQGTIEFITDGERLWVKTESRE